MEVFAFNLDRRLYGEISKLVYRMIQRFYNAAAGRRVQSAAVIAYSSAGEFARWNPHLHAIFLEGGFDREGRFVHVQCLNLSKLSQYFRASMVAFFLKRTLLNERLARNTITMLSDQSSDSQARLAFAGCTHRAHDPPGSAAPTSCAFLRCPRHRLRASIRQAAESIEYGRASSTWARLIAKLYGADPLICPRCGNSMRVLAIITDPSQVDRILRHLIKIGRAPPGLILAPRH